MDPESGQTRESETPTPEPSTSRKRPAGKKATVNEKIEVLTLASRGVNQREIARITGLSQQAISDIVIRHQPTTAHALDVLRANSFKAAEDWVRSFNVAVKRGEHRPMRDALIATGVVAPDPQAQGITVIVGSGDVQISPTLPNVPSIPSAAPRLGPHNPDQDS